MSELELNVGARVYCNDGKCGRLAARVVEAEQGPVTHIIIEQGFLEKHFRLLPIAIVEQATTGDVYLAVSDAELARFPEYQEQRLPAWVARSGNGTRVNEELYV